MQVKYTCVGTEVRKFVYLGVSMCVSFVWQDKLGKSVNMRAMNMLGKVEEKVGNVHVCVYLWVLCSFFATRNACMYTLLSFVEFALICLCTFVYQCKLHTACT